MAARKSTSGAPRPGSRFPAFREGGVPTTETRRRKEEVGRKLKKQKQSKLHLVRFPSPPSRERSRAFASGWRPLRQRQGEAPTLRFNATTTMTARRTGVRAGKRQRKRGRGMKFDARKREQGTRLKPSESGTDRARTGGTHAVDKRLKTRERDRKRERESNEERANKRLEIQYRRNIHWRSTAVSRWSDRGEEGRRGRR